MPFPLETFTQQINWTRYHNQQGGHYESFFQRANHPTRPLAFWIRYTIFSPKGHPEEAVGELWAIYFNGETGHHIAVKKAVPLHQCIFHSSEFCVEIDEAYLKPWQLEGSINDQHHIMAWNLSFSTDAQPLLLLPLSLYTTKFPAAKSLVASPLAMFNGYLTVNDERIDVTDWPGSQNHNWGSKHTDLYAWGQVAGFENFPESFLEVATARLKIGPLWTPALTLLVLRHRDREFALNSLSQSVRAKGSFEYFLWKFRSETSEITIDGTIVAPREAFVGLSYANPPGGSKHCLNTKIASCTLHITYKKSRMEETLTSPNRAAFEILTDDRQHGITMSA
jgi:hypothetical protein